ncbi:MAG: hypothetical protein LUC22_01995 [Prevotella sp.]|nr:hypothetical protein [Prevotella sp.]
MNNKRIVTKTFKEAEITVSYEALAFLKGTTGGVSHFAIFADLVMNMATVSATFDKRGITVPLLPGQAEASANSLAGRWGLSRKVLTRLLAAMQQHGLIRLSTSKLTSVATLISVKSWLSEDGDCFTNELTAPQTEQQAADRDTHADTPEETTLSIRELPSADGNNTPPSSIVCDIPNKTERTPDKVPDVPSNGSSDGDGRCSQRTTSPDTDKQISVGRLF